MSNPTYNKWKSTTIYGNLKVRDLTNSTGTSVVETAYTDLSGNLLCRGYFDCSGNATFTNPVTCDGTISSANHLTTKSFTDSNYFKISDASDNYLKITDASNTYLKLIDASNNYLKLIDASNTYLKITDASNNYLKLIDASNNYLKLIDASNNYASLSGNNTITGNITYSNAVTCNGTISNSNHLATKSYVDSVVSSGGGTQLLSSNNTWSGANTFNTYLPTSTQTPTNSNDLTTKTFVDSAISGLSSVYQTISGMSSYLTTATASSTYQTISGMSSYLTTATASSTYQTIANMSSYFSLAGNNTASGNNTFSNAITCNGTITNSNHLATKSYVDSVSGGASLTGNNTFTGNNLFNGTDTTISNLTIGKILQLSNTTNSISNLNITGTNGLTSSKFQQSSQPGGSYLTNSMDNLTTNILNTTEFSIKPPINNTTSLGYIYTTYTQNYTPSAVTNYTGLKLITFNVPNANSGGYGLWYIYFSVYLTIKPYYNVITGPLSFVTNCKVYLQLETTTGTVITQSLITIGNAAYLSTNCFYTGLVKILDSGNPYSIRAISYDGQFNLIEYKDFYMIRIA